LTSADIARLRAATFLTLFGGPIMPQYMFQFAYTSQAWAALAEHPADRSEEVTKMAKKMGGKLVSLYYTMGEYDGMAILEAPNDEAVMALVIAAVAPGHLRMGKTTRLFSATEAVAAMKKAHGAGFKAPA
jgi:uncharacterized protein with GYD domain